jgi:hypothetical protein
MALFTSPNTGKTYSTVQTPKYKYKRGNKDASYWSAEPNPGNTGVSPRLQTKLENFRKLVEDEIKKSPEKSISLERSKELFKKAMGDAINPTGPGRSLAGEYSRFKNLYPSYFKGLSIVKNDQELFRNYLLKRAKANPTPVETTIKDLLKESKINFSDKFTKSKDARTLAGNVIRQNPQLKAKFLLTGTGGIPAKPGGIASKIPTIYETSKKFKSFYDSGYDTPWKDASYDAKYRAVLSFEKRAAPLPAGYTLTVEELAEKLGLGKATVNNAFIKSSPDYNLSTSKFIRENFSDYKKYKAPGVKGSPTRYWKEPSDLVMRRYKSLQNSRRISSSMINNIEDLYNNPKIYKTIFTDKKLPPLEDVQAVLNNRSPATAANAMATLARVLRGDDFRTPVNVKRDVVAGKRILDQIGSVGKNNAYRTAFYNAALFNVDNIYKGKSNVSLSDFKNTFRNELRTILGLKSKEVIPFSVNEVIGITTGEMRGLQPYTAFVDITARNINENALAAYQGQLSHRINQIQTVMKGGKYEGVNYSNVSEAGRVAKAEELAGKLIDTKNKAQATLMDPEGDYRLSRKQVDQLGMADIKIGTKIDPKIYSPEQLARYKTKGLDIQGMADREGFYIDTKGRRPFFDVSTKELKKVAENLSKKEQLEVCSLLSGGGLPGNCAKAIDENPVKFSQIVSESPATTTAMQKLKTTALGFLKSPGVKRFTLAGAAGAGVQAIVKEFRNDDPTSYLSNEDQQKSMLVAMATDPIAPDFERPAILDYQLPAMGATALGATALTAPSTIKASRSRGLGVEQKGMMRTAGRVLGRGLGVAAAPGLLAPFAAGDIASQIAEGDSLADVATDPFNYLYPAFADATPKLTKGLPSAVRGIASLGMSPAALRVLSRAGILGFGASLGLQGMKLLQDD